MDEDVAELAHQLLESGVARLSEREKRVILLIAKRLHVARDVNSVVEEHETSGERLADKVAQWGGSWAFIAFFTGLLIAWVIGNTFVLSSLVGRSIRTHTFS